MYSPGRGIRLRGSARTNTGRVRENNEDHVHLWGKNHFVLAIVADGMGGAVAGEEASRIAVETIHQHLVESEDQIDFYDSMSADILSDKLRDVVRSANLNIVQRTQTHPELKGMGTTVTMAMVRNTYAVIGHVGDSRAYLVDGHDGSISQITSDHSFVEAMVAAGHITRDEAEDHPMRNVLYRALGQAEEIDVDVYHSYLRVGDRLVLCSDGLTLHVKSHEIAQIALADSRPEVASQKMIDLANERGGRDNVTVIVISVEEDTAHETKQKVMSDEAARPDDEETLAFGERRPFVSSESENSPKLENRDGKSNALSKMALKQHRTPLLAHPIGLIHTFKKDNLGEGHDLNKPEQ
jgi:PPM family protein phosphatase